MGSSEHSEISLYALHNETEHHLQARPWDLTVTFTRKQERSFSRRGTWKEPEPACPLFLFNTVFKSMALLNPSPALRPLPPSLVLLKAMQGPIVYHACFSVSSRSGHSEAAQNPGFSHLHSHKGSTWQEKREVNGFPLTGHSLHPHLTPTPLSSLSRSPCSQIRPLIFGGPLNSSSTSRNKQKLWLCP